MTRYAAFQAKKFDGSTQIDARQYDTLTEQFGDAGAYLFYDMDFSTLAPPIVIEADDLAHARKEKSTASFSLPRDRVFGGLPLSLWFVSRLVREQTGVSMASLKAAMDAFVEPAGQTEYSAGRMAILSVGRPLRLTRHAEAGLVIEV